MDGKRDDLWTISFEGLTPLREKTISTLLTVGNGRAGVRGYLPELCPGHDAGIFLAGFYDELPRPELDPDSFNPFLLSWSHMDLVPGYHREKCIVKCPDFLDCVWLCGEEVIDIHNARLLSLTRSLCIKNGLFTASMHWQTPSGKELMLFCERFADMSEENRIWVRYTIKPLNFSGDITYRSTINPNRKNSNISGIYKDAAGEEDQRYYRLYDVERTSLSEDGTLSMSVRGRVNGMKAGFTTTVFPKTPGVQKRVWRRDEETVFADTVLPVEQGAETSITRLSVFSLDSSSAPGLHASDGWESFNEAFEKSARVWEMLWEDSDVRIIGDDNAQLSIRHSLYHLLISACRSGDHVSVPAKGLSGEGYRGMVFWDTDIHMLPFYLYTQPKIARNLVRFRYNTLYGARKKAEDLDCRGACYPWETSVSGFEECEYFLKLWTHQLHVTVDAVYAMRQYLEATGDEDFLTECAEVFWETARFWLSKGRTENRRFGIPDASGPDELHLEVSNSAYINNLVAMNLELALKAKDTLQRKYPRRFSELLSKTGMSRAEFRKMRYCLKRINTKKNKEGLFEQFDGYFNLRDEIVFEDDPFIVPADTQTVKQADVLMLLYLLPDLVTREQLRVNWDYYEKRTTHTSSLSFGVHGILAARLGMMEKAVDYLNRSLGIDLFRDEANADDGAHMAAYGMNWSAVVFGFGGISFNQGKISVAPALPAGWNEIAFCLRYKKNKLSFRLRHEGVTVCCEESGSGKIAAVDIRGKTYFLHVGETICHNAAK